MSARKSKDLIVRHDTKTDRSRRADRETALTPRKPLTVKSPAELTGAVGQKTWKETVSLYFTLDARIVSILDRGLLIDYCIACDQLAEIDGLRVAAVNQYISAKEALEKLLAQKGELNAKTFLQVNNSVNWSYDEILKLDARADQKRKMILSMRQSLYLTPRARAGALPSEKQPEKPQSAMSQLIDGKVKKEKEVTDV